MSIVKFKDLTFNNETLKKCNKCHNVDLKRAINSPKYLIIDWTGVKPEDIDFSNIDDDLMRDYLSPKNINNKEVLGFLIQKYDKKDPELLWIYLVDFERAISHELYVKNTFDENMNVLMKITNFLVPVATVEAVNN